MLAEFLKHPICSHECEPRLGNFRFQCSLMSAVTIYKCCQLCRSDGYVRALYLSQIINYRSHLKYLRLMSHNLID